MLFYDEVENVEELKSMLEYNLELKIIKVAVICFIFTKDGKVILNRRGPGARDDVGLLQAIGGSVNKSDIDFRDAMRREIEEETGSKTVQISDFIGAYHDRKMDNETKETVDWVILGYLGYLEDGNLFIKELDKSYDLETLSLDEIREDELSKSTYRFIEEIKRMKWKIFLLMRMER